MSEIIFATCYYKLYGERKFPKRSNRVCEDCEVPNLYWAYVRGLKLSNSKRRPKEVNNFDLLT